MILEKKNCKKIILFAFLLFFVFAVLLLPTAETFAQRGLETAYPEAGGIKPTTIETPIAEYVKYIFNFAIAFAGLIAFGILVWSGIQYLTSAGSPEILKTAQTRIKSAFLGILILLFSYLILVTINPRLITFNLSDLPKIPVEELPGTPISPFITKDLMGKIKNIAMVIKGTANREGISDTIKSAAQNIGDLTNQCSCNNTESLCLCADGTNSGCQPSSQSPQCHSNPCPNFEKIQAEQQKIIVWTDELLYYKNRAIAEQKDLKIDIEKYLNKKISWHNTAINKEKNQRIIDYLTEEKQWLEYERRYKRDLVMLLEGLINIIEKARTPADELSQSSDKCLNNLKACAPQCAGACHDMLKGCQPQKCSGGNPCPAREIQKEIGKISSVSANINSICGKIISKIDSIEKTRERKTQI